MFGRRKPSAEPLGPFEFEHCIDIDRPAPEVYALIDWADPRNAKRVLGNKVEQVGSAPDRYRLQLDLVPDHRFEMIVTEAVPSARYAFENAITPSVGRLAASHESYTIKAIDAHSCRLGLTIAASFIAGLNGDDLAVEAVMMGMSGENALAKLKVQAEQGPAAVHAIEAAQMDGLATMVG